MITNQDRRTIRQLYRKVKSETDPLLAKRLADPTLPSSNHPEIDKLMAIQNTMRITLEVALNECVPFSEFLVGELASRLAAYCISVVPIERQQVLLAAVIDALPRTLENKLREQAIMKSVWGTDGVEHKNVPDRNEVN